MGYVTDYSLEITPPDCEPWEVPQDMCIGELLTGEWSNDPWRSLYARLYEMPDEGSPVLRGESCKWYSHEDDMREVSRECPDVLFSLTGKGEESGDTWVKYFLDGRMQTARADIYIAPFDPAKLDDGAPN